RSIQSFLQFSSLSAPARGMPFGQSGFLLISESTNSFRLRPRRATSSYRVSFIAGRTRPKGPRRFSQWPTERRRCGSRRGPFGLARPAMKLTRYELVARRGRSRKLFVDSLINKKPLWPKGIPRAGADNDENCKNDWILLRHKLKSPWVFF